MSWFVYIVRCSDHSLYTGVTTDIDRRTREHNSSKLGAKYTRVRRPVTLVYSEACENRAEACRREYQIRQLPRCEKLTLIQQMAFTNVE